MAAVATAQQKSSSQPPKFSVGTTSHAIHLYTPKSVIEEFKDFAAIPKLHPQQRRLLQAAGMPVPRPLRGQCYPLLPKEKENEDAVVINFWPCFPSMVYELIASSKENSSQTFTMTITTRPSLLKNPSMIILNSKELMENPGIMDLILACEDDYVVTLEQGIVKNSLFLEKLFWNALFILPHDDSPLSSCPNSKKRFCIDLENGVKDPEVWLSGKKAKKYLKNKNEFELELTNDFAALLAEAGEIHDEVKGSTWIIPEFTESLQKLAKLNKTSSIQLVAFVLREKVKDDECDEGEKNTNSEDAGAVTSSKKNKKGDPVAATFGFACGQNFHDYTMSTFSQDYRSCGSLVTKLSGYILQKAGFKLWYWGMQVNYMKEYVGKYGAVEFDRPQFYEKWNKFREIQLEKPLAQSAAEICAGINLSFRNVEI